MDVAGISSMIREFQKESMKTEMKQEMIGDAMDMGDANEEADDVYNSILGEIGLQVDQSAQIGTGAVPSKKPAMVQEEAKEEEIDDLEKRLAALGQ